MPLRDLFERNRAWAAAQLGHDPRFFERLCDIQRPDYLWIGCADSRVPANVIVGLDPGEMFVHRNIANIVRPDDDNCMAVLQFAIEELRVKHVIVTGHYGCGGVRAAFEGGTQSFVRRWLTPLRAIAQEHRQELDRIGERHARLNRLTELNVMAQVETLANTQIVKQAWSFGRPLAIHGWVYDLRNGLLQDLRVTRTRA
jgi:carbonic anhydrase